MAHEIQSQAGVSLAEVYDVKGTQAPIETLKTAEGVNIVHEMGGTIFSERFSTTIRRRETGLISQSSNWDEVISNLPAGASRILGITVLSGGVSQIAVATVSLRDPISKRELPIWSWVAGDLNQEMRMEDDGGGISNTGVAVAPFTNLPQILTGVGQPQRVPDIAFRGSTTAFGAGTVNIVLLVHIAFAAIGGISSTGLPIPSW